MVNLLWMLVLFRVTSVTQRGLPDRFSKLLQVISKRLIIAPLLLILLCILPAEVNNLFLGHPAHTINLCLHVTLIDLWPLVQFFTWLSKGRRILVSLLRLRGAIRFVWHIFSLGVCRTTWHYLIARFAQDFCILRDHCLSITRFIFYKEEWALIC